MSWLLDHHVWEHLHFLGPALALYVGAGVYLLTMFKVTHIGAPMIALMLILLGERRWYVVIPCALAPVGLLYLLSVHLMRVGVV